jgi:hypothetical protein
LVQEETQALFAEEHKVAGHFKGDGLGSLVAVSESFSKWTIRGNLVHE